MQPVTLFDYDHWYIWQYWGSLDAPVWGKGYGILCYADQDDISLNLTEYLLQYR